MLGIRQPFVLIRTVQSGYGPQTGFLSLLSRLFVSTLL